ncbi:MAG: hypothetical protein EON60_11470 [Alphaproteobacteria bacterium]|nr:MAG: hypothetical protein EON60_11470 [Alphaproteobacteria bacterium]
MRLILALMLLAMPAHALTPTATFPFEDYTDAETFNTAVNTAFPAGTNVQDLEKTLIRSGAQVSHNPATPNKVYVYRKYVGKLYNSAAWEYTVTVAANGNNVRSISTNYGLISIQPKKIR